MIFGLAIVVFILIIVLTLLFVYKRKASPEIIDIPTKSTGEFRKILITVLIICSSIFVYFKFTDRPVIPKDFIGIVFGMTKDEVLYVMGKPEKTIKFDGKHIVALELIDVSAYDKKENHWYYKHSTHGVNVFYDEKTEKVNQVSCNLTEDRYTVGVTYCETNRVGLGSKEEKIIDILGIPDEVRFSDGLKFISYKKFNTTFTLNKKEVTQIVVSSSDKKLDWKKQSSSLGI